MNYGQLQTAVARDLRDPGNLTFDATVVKDFIESAITELSMIAPEFFQEDIEPVEDQRDYTLRSDVFAAPVPEIEVKRVEVWDGSVSPAKYIARLRAKSEARLDTSANGWEVWNGTLSLTNGVVASLKPETHLIRVWGWSPYAMPVDDSDDPTWSHEIEQAVRTYCRVLSMEALLSERNLFSQWQTRSGNTDISPAGLNNELATQRGVWRSKAARLGRLRAAN